MDLREIGTDIKEFFERGKALAETHVPELLARAEKLDGNVMFQAAENALHIPAEAQSMVAELIGKLAAMFPVPAAGPGQPGEPQPGPQPGPESAA